MAVLTPRPRSDAKFLTMNDTLTSGITKVAATAHLPIVESWYQYGDPTTHEYITDINIRSLVKSVTNANLGFGEHIATYPLGLIEPLGGTVEFTTLTTTGCANGGEIGLGSVIASGAVATLGGTTTFGDQMDGTTVAALTAATTETFVRSNKPDLTGTKATHGIQHLDGSVTAAKLFLNWAGDHDASETFTFSAKIRVRWRWLGTGLANGIAS